jgi:hypothetical protein
LRVNLRLKFRASRDRLLTAQKEEESGLINQMLVDVQDDIKLAREMQNYVKMDSVMGFESEIYDHSYSPTILDEKIAHDSVVARTLARWEQTGVDRRVLLTTLPSTRHPDSQERATWQQWLRWGD